MGNILGVDRDTYIYTYYLWIAEAEVNTEKMR